MDCLRSVPITVNAPAKVKKIEKPTIITNLVAVETYNIDAAKQLGTLVISKQHQGP